MHWTLKSSPSHIRGDLNLAIRQLWDLERDTSAEILAGLEPPRAFECLNLAGLFLSM